jgi:hypothetical protein
MCGYVFTTAPNCAYVSSSSPRVFREKAHLMEDGEFILQKCGRGVLKRQHCPGAAAQPKPKYKDIIDISKRLVLFIKTGLMVNTNDTLSNDLIPDLRCSKCRGVKCEG